MASIGKDPNGRKRILFVDQDGKRKTVYLGKASMRQALAFNVRFENLIAGRFSGIDTETAQWLAALPDDMYGKLARLELVSPRQSAQKATLATFIDSYIENRHDIKQRTKWVLQQARQSLVNHFGPDKHLNEINEGDAELWWQAMVKEGQAEATRRKRAQNAKQFFAFASKQGLVSSNPFQGLKSSAKGNDSRLHFVSHEDIEKVIDACPCHEWKLIFALCRYGGLRSPSEVLALRWEDINWEQDRMLVRSEKTERHEGGGSRLVPIFGELRPYLIEAFERAEPGTVHCITRYRQASCNLRTQAHRIIKRAGLEPWTRTFQNLRASRETELTERFPLHVVTSWIGNSQLIAARHYLTVRDTDFERAAKSAQNPTQCHAATPCERVQHLPEDGEKNAVFQCVTADFSAMHESLLAPRGFKPLLPG